jgi:hypothetical protein
MSGSAEGGYPYVPRESALEWDLTAVSEGEAGKRRHITGRHIVRIVGSDADAGNATLAGGEFSQS